MYCSSSLMAAYPKMGPSLPDPVYPPPPTSYTAQPYMTFATEASAFYSPMVSSWASSDNFDSWRSLPHHTTWPYDSTMSPYPYTPTYGGLDVRRKNATRESTSTLKAWLYEHIKNPYPTKGEKIMLAIITKMTLTQVSTWFANARRRLKKENKMQWSPRNRAGEDEDDKSVDSDNPSDSTNNVNNNNTNNIININNNNKDGRKDKMRDVNDDKNHMDEDETIVVDNIIGDDILMSISDRRNKINMSRGTGSDVTSYLACSSLSSNKHSTVANDNQRTPSNRFQSNFTDPGNPQQLRNQPSTPQRKFLQPLSMPACGNIGLSLTPSSSSSSSFHSASPLPSYNIFSQTPSGTNFYPHPSFMHGFPPSYCASGTGFSSRDYNCNSNRSLFSHSYKPLTPCGTTDSQLSSSDSSQPFLNLSVSQLSGMMPTSIEGVSKPRIWSLADVATSVESPAAVIMSTYSTSDSLFNQQFLPGTNPYFSTPSRGTSDDPDKKTAAASLPFKGHDNGKNESLEEEYESLVMNSMDRRQDGHDKSLKNQILNSSDERYFPSCGGPYSSSYNFPFPDRSFQRRQDYNNLNCSSSSSLSSSSSSSSSFSLFPGSFFGNASGDMIPQVHNGTSPTYFQTYGDETVASLERSYREEKTKNKISIA